MRTVAVLAAVLFAVTALAPGNAQPAPLRVTGKTSASVSLSWSGWNMTGATKHAIYRNGTPMVIWGADNSKVSHSDTSVGWGTTFSYFLRVTLADGTTKDTNTVWVTTNAPTVPLNIVLILTDDQRWDTLPYMPWVQQLLVQSGVTFTHAFAATPQCCPSRSGLLSGLHSHNHKVLSNRLGARYFDDRSTLATWLQAAGYRTALIGKYLNGYADSSCQKLYGSCFTNPAGIFPWPYTPPGWNDWRAFRRDGFWNYVLMENDSQVGYGTAPNEYSTLVLQQRAVDFIDATPVGQPLFLLFTAHAPHQPATYEAQDEGLYASITPWRPPSYNEADVSDKPAWVQDLPLLDATASANLDFLRIKQLRSLQSVDRAVKVLYDTIAARGELDKTVFVFTSDNPQSWGEHRWTAKMCPYDECARIPLVVRIPNGPVRTDEHLITLIDLVPSIAAWSGMLHPKVDGMSLARLTTTPTMAWRDALLVEMLDGESTQQTMLHSTIRTKQYLYAEYLNGDRELYNLAADPFLLTNVAGQPEYAGIIATLKAKLDALKRQ